MKKWIGILLALSVILTGCGAGDEQTSSDEWVVHQTPLDQIGESSEQTESKTDIVTSSEENSEPESSEPTNSEPESSEPTSSEPVSSQTSSEEETAPTYTPAVTWEEPESGDWNLVLVNAITPIADGHQMTLVNYNESIQCDERILGALKAMMKAAAADGVSVYPTSGYRSKERSKYLYERQVQQYLDRGYSEENALKIAAHWVAPPGTSEHHTGLAFDFLSNESTTMNATFANTKAAKWLYEHAAEYGFILRFPQGKEDITGITFEPWHYRYVGTEAAAYIRSKEITLEEYLGAPSVGYEEIEE